jgi:hypothetical protein
MSRQLLQQRLHLLQIARVEPLRKPPVNGSQQFARPHLRHPNQTGQCQRWRRQNGPVRMYTRALLFKRCSRLAALYSILETGRQPSLGGKGLAMADAQASSDAAMTTATVALPWRNDMSLVSEVFVALPLLAQFLQQRFRLLQIARVEPFREPPVNRSCRASALVGQNGLIV